MSLARVQVIIKGRVQGVFFRAEARRKAEELGLTGWVRNNPDGTVEAVFVGDEPEVRDMVAACRRDAVGGLLAALVSDTVKQADEDGRSFRTLPREHLWRAQTPQMFRLGTLSQALDQALAAGFEPTDESAAIEKLGLRPRLVEGSPLNVKVTRPADLAFAAAAFAAVRRHR